MNTHLYHQTGTSAVTDCMRAAERIVRKHATPANSDGRTILRRAGFADTEEVRRAVLYMRVKERGGL